MDVELQKNDPICEEKSALHNYNAPDYPSAALTANLATEDLNISYWSTNKGLLSWLGIVPMIDSYQKIWIFLRKRHPGEVISSAADTWVYEWNVETV